MLPAMPNPFNCVPHAGYCIRSWIATQFSPSSNRKREGDGMKFRPWSSVVAVTLFTTLAVLVGVAEQTAPAQETPTKHHHYKLIDVGTFGGPNSSNAWAGIGNRLMNSGGTVMG